MSKEQQPQSLEEMDMEELMVVEELLSLYEADGHDVDELRKKVWKLINKPDSE